MKIHILGICGSFMGGIALIAKQLGHQVSGSDTNIYPPMSTQLEQQGVVLFQDSSDEQFVPSPDLVIIGNALSRGNSGVEYVLNQNLPYISGPAWLSENVLQYRHVLAIAGTHGKTTTASMLAWVLEFAGLQSGYMIGGVPENFAVSARLGKAPYFVIEADEYDSAFFDKRSKFLHYHPRTLVLNNLEFDHADIFADLAAIQTQFHHLVRIVPEQGLIVRPENDENLQQVIEQGCWTAQQLLGIKGWHAKALSDDNSQFTVYFADEIRAEVSWSLIGEHNQNNALAVFAAADHIGITAEKVALALAGFKNVKRRMQIIANQRGVTVYDDFAHHPTAIKLTLEGLRHKIAQQKIIAVIELGSYTMRCGEHQHTLLPAIASADEVIFYQEDQTWSIEGTSETPWKTCNSSEEIIASLDDKLEPDTHLIIMSNRGFADLHQRIKQLLLELT